MPASHATSGREPRVRRAVAWRQTYGTAASNTSLHYVAGEFEPDLTLCGLKIRPWAVMSVDPATCGRCKRLAARRESLRND